MKPVTSFFFGWENQKGEKWIIKGDREVRAGEKRKKGRSPDGAAKSPGKSLV